MSKAEKAAIEHGYKNGSYPEYSADTVRQAFISGYQQAEKDLDVVSWIKEVSGVKEMSRAKEEALKAYPPLNIAANYDTIARRDAFEYGYLKAEKDLELTWEDIKQICDIAFEVACRFQRNMKGSLIYKEQHYQEVLKRFKTMKGEKV